ncbi:ATP-binding protein [Ammoniphilus sp. 3BR4]|uniref:HAMP domain-containing sensor histidine kinase n=1 Tax=Ammoniphilus sp. 3BR4 TaxID=3158265 RepID=UPI0034677F5D
MKLQNKINLYTAVLFASLLILINFSIYYLFSNLILDSELKTAKDEMKKIATTFNESLGTIPERELLRAYVPIDGMILVVKEDNGSAPAVTSPAEQDLSKRTEEYYTSEVSKTIVENGRTYAFGSMPIILPDGNVANLQITKSIQTTIENIRILQLVLIGVTILAMIPVMISSRVLSNLITKPVTTMIATMTDIRQSGQFKRLSLEEKSKDELHQMGETFNHMIDLLETNFEKQKQFVSNASHELKTPLTVIESYASLLKRRGLKEPELFDESIEAIHSEAIRMKELTEQLLLLAKHNEQWNIKRSLVNLPEFLEQTVKSFQSAYDREIRMEYENTEMPMVETDEQKLKQLLFIFLDNARKYSDDIIRLSIGASNVEGYIRIIDRGIGIHQDDLPKVFDRFYRVDKARTRKNGGSGLGLSLAKEIAEAIGVQIKLESIEGVGTTATIVLKN